jgi:putative Mg2+ transporter-C (MgtC) family protein
MSVLAEPSGQGWPQLVELGTALVLSAVIGCERELRQKSAGLRTHTLIGFSAAVIMLVSKYGFTDVLGEHVVLDPSRVAAQIVSGIGFIGGGLIFVRRDAVRGLTTAAAVWLTTAIGMAAGAGLPLLAVATTAGYLIVVYGLARLSRLLRRSRPRARVLEVVYEDGRGLLRSILRACTTRGWTVEQLSVRTPEAGLIALRDTARERPGDGAGQDPWPVAVVLGLFGTGEHADIAGPLCELDGVLLVRPADNDDHDPEVE